MQTEMPDGEDWGGVGVLFTAWLPRARRFLGLWRECAGELHVCWCAAVGYFFFFFLWSVGRLVFAYFRIYFPFVFLSVC